MASDGPTYVSSIRWSVDLRSRLEELARRRGLTTNGLVVSVLEELCAREGLPPRPVEQVES